MTQCVALVGELAEQIRGVTYAKSEASLEPRDGYTPIVRAGNIAGGRLTFEDLVYVPAERVSRQQMLRRHDVLIATSSGSLDVVGKAASVEADVEVGFGAFCRVLRPSDRVDPRYFAHVFQTPAYRAAMSRAAAGANINNLRVADLAEIEIPLPPIEEQRRIVAVLDEADDLRAKRDTSLALLDSLNESIFLDMFGDPRAAPRFPTMPLGQLADLYAGGTLPSGSPWADQRGGYMLAKVSDLNLPGNERWIERTNLWSDSPGTRSATCPSEAIVIPKRGGAIGTNKKRLTRRPTVLDPNLMGIAPTRDLAEPLWLYQWFQMFDLQAIVSGSSVPQLNKQDLAPLPIAVPPLDEQATFVARIEQAERVDEAAAASRSHLESLFAALQHRAFAGQL